MTSDLKEYIGVEGKLNGKSGKSIFNKEGHYLGFVFDNYKELGVRLPNGAKIPHDFQENPIEFLVNNISPDKVNCIDNMLMQTR